MKVWSCSTQFSDWLILFLMKNSVGKGFYKILPVVTFQWIRKTPNSIDLELFSIFGLAYFVLNEEISSDYKILPVVTFQ